MFRNVTLLAAAMLFALAAGGVFADDDDDRLELTALVRGNANPVPTEDPCILVNTETAKGLALNIGKITWKSEEVVDFSSNPDCFRPDGAEIEAKFVITVEDLGEILGVYQTVAQIDAFSNEITALGHYEITGGTGKFEDAEGKGVITAVGSLLPAFEFVGELIGRISSDAD